MTTTVAAAIAALFQKMSGQNHQAVFKIIINAFDEFGSFFVFGFFFLLHLIKEKMPPARRRI